MPRKREGYGVWPVYKNQNGRHYDNKIDGLLLLDYEDDTFHIGQSYEDVAATTVECKLCGSRSFNVGEGNYFTAIKCVKCKWELMIHEG